MDVNKKNKLMSYLRSVIFILGLIVLVKLSDFVFARDGYVNYILKVLNKGYEVNEDGQITTSDKGYDLIVLGASHARSAIDTEYIDETLGTNSLNLAIPGETVKDSYYLLLEATRNNDIKTVVLDVDYQYYLGDNGEGYFEEAFIYNQYSWFSSTKWKYLLDNMNELDFRNAISKRDVYTHSLTDIKRNVNQKLSKDYLNSNIYKLEVEDCGGYYMGKGFFYRNQEDGFYNGYCDKNALCADSEIDAMPRKYFEKIKKYCEDNGIELICETSPITPTSYEELNISLIHEKMSDFFKSYGVTYIDYNMASFDLFDRNQEDYVDAEGHMCGELALKFSKLLAQNLEEIKLEGIDFVLNKVYGEAQ
jgi:hypothetical protein